SEVLDGYSILTGKIWEYRSSKKTLEESIELAVEYCLGKGILADFIKKHSSEIHSMLYGEYRIEDEIAVVKRETREETWEECSKHEKQTIARNLLSKGSTLEFTSEITGLDLETIRELSSAS
ncbi:MAG: hypothetical protein FWD28_10455, partial [Treponema sp.]|nr:hypothetical protein [Treponema sp.]